MWCPLYGAPPGRFLTSGSKCAPGKKNTFAVKESELKHSCRPGFQIEIARLWCRTPTSYCTAACLACLSSLSFSRPKPIHLSPKNTQYYCPSRPAAEEMMASTNINDNQRLCQAKRHKRSSSPCTSSNTYPRIRNYRCLKKMFIGKSYFSISDPSIKSHTCTPAQAKDCVVDFPVWVITAYF